MSAKELFDAVKTAEADAEVIVQNAQHKARDIIKESETACVSMERTLTQEYRTMYQQLLDERRTQVEEKIQISHAERERQQDIQMEIARSKLDAAAQSIIERILSDGNR